MDNCPHYANIVNKRDFERSGEESQILDRYQKWINIMIFIVKERTKEIGIRKALGAPPVSIERLITFESILITSISGFLGLIAGSVILDSMEETLKEYFIKDPGVSTSLVIGATITLIIAGTIAAYLPAKRASRIKPIVALRDE